ncbi:MAG: hypothetical protein OXG52_03960 [bacterium]|nr:hypothetical protein [bacterium]
MSAGSNATGAGDPAAEAAPTVIRLALTPDPIWQWLEDSGTRAAWEQANNIQLEVGYPFDQFASFVSGHADAVIINALDVPKFAQQPDRAPVVIGKYTSDRTILAVRRTSRAESLEDLVERRIAVENSLGSMLLWGLIAEIRYELDFALDSADFDLVTVNPASLADLVMRGDVDACICLPEFSVPYLADGRLRPLYDGRSAANLYSASIFGGEQYEHELKTIADALVLDADWHDANLHAVDALLDLWDEGVTEWNRDSARIVSDYPHHFSVESDADIAWLTDYVATHDWIVPSVYITPEEAKTHHYAIDRLRSLGLLPADTARPDLHDFHSPHGSHSTHVSEHEHGAEPEPHGSEHESEAEHEHEAEHEPHGSEHESEAEHEHEAEG